jgi:hypothetical protein
MPLGNGTTEEKTIQPLPPFQGIHLGEACPEEAVEQGAFPWWLNKVAIRNSEPLAIRKFSN